MDRNYALEPEEIAAGIVLACQSHPVTETVSPRLRRLTNGPNLGSVRPPGAKPRERAATRGPNLGERAAAPMGRTHGAQSLGLRVLSACVGR